MNEEMKKFFEKHKELKNFLERDKDWLLQRKIKSIQAEIDDALDRKDEETFLRLCVAYQSAIQDANALQQASKK